MRTNITRNTARDLRQGYIQQYLKQFLRRVHPDLFQQHPKEQVQNSASLQDLLPLVGQEKNKGSADTHVMSSIITPTNSKSTKLIFYYRPKAITTLRSVEHILPAIDDRVSLPDQSAANLKQDALDREIRSWQMVQSFLELCKKVDVPVKDPDWDEVSQLLSRSRQEAAAKQSSQQRAPQKPLSEIFAEELQSSFSGSTGAARSASFFSGSDMGSGVQGDISHSHLNKVGGTALVLDAQVMIKSNPLLFKSPEISSSRLSKIIRTWIHWQEEDQYLQEMSPDHAFQKPFRLSDWWRKVPVMIMSSSAGRAKFLATQTDTGQSAKGMLIVDQEMSKQGMTYYLYDNLSRVQKEYKEMLQAATSSTPLSSSPSSATRVHDFSKSPLAEQNQTLSPEAASYLERMRAKSVFRSAAHRHTRGSFGRNGSPNKRWS
ncbi:hypothetical protein BG011_004778 [Mortierella polycephala]|uniref:DUF4460 domain-containing protein n=1 Tax=Mortierella polycephala TaxID=41804 RepID=A0A9P6U9G3_9FUNG|nr:hypothetical protein BG011_004778 [Mortierella polycephala]